MRTLIRVILISAIVAGVIALILYTDRVSKAGDVPGRSSGPLLVGTNVWPGYEPLFLARELEYFADSDIRLVEYTSATEVIRGFRNETIGVAALTLDEVMLLWQDDIRARVILVMDVSHGADAILSKPELKSLRDLRGKRVGIESSASGAYVISRALSTAQMSVRDITVIPLEVDEHEKAFNNGEIDAVVTFEPVRSLLLSAGARQLFDSTQIPGEIVGVLVASEHTLKYRADELKRLVSGWFQALRYLDEHPQAAALLMSDRLRLSSTETLDAFEGLRLMDYSENREMLGEDPTNLGSTAQRLASVMVEADLLRGDIDVTELLENSVLNDITGEF